jgi:hypothetical protein
MFLRLLNVVPFLLDRGSGLVDIYLDLGPTPCGDAVLC